MIVKSMCMWVCVCVCAYMIVIEDTLDKAKTTVMTTEAQPGILI